MLLHAMLMALSFAAEAPATQPAANTAVEVGSVAPDFTLTDSDGGIHKLSDLRGRKNVVLVFFRGTW